MPSKKDKIIIDLCGGSGAWAKPYKDAGYTVYTVTLPAFDVTDPKVIEWCVSLKPYGILAAPPCTKFSKAAWNIKKADRDFKEGMRVVRACMEIIWQVQENGAPLKFWALENPMGYLYNFLGRPVFYFQPWQFGQEGFTATKRTAIWGYFKSPVKTTRKRTIPFINPHSSKRDQVSVQKENTGWYKASAAERAVTDPGFAQAFYQANQ